MSITAERIRNTRMAAPAQWLYRLSEPTTSEQYPEPFDHVVLSLGRAGDTCVFPSDPEGHALDMVGFGFGLGPDRWLIDDEFDAYVAACIRQHEADGGSGYAIAGDDWRDQAAEAESEDRPATLIRDAARRAGIEREEQER